MGFTAKMESDIQVYLSLESYDKLFKKMSKLQRDKLDMYLIRLSIKAGKKDRQQGEFIFANALKEVL